MRRRLLQFRSKKHSKEAPATASSASSSAEPPTPSPTAQTTDAVQHGLEVVYEGTDPVVDIVAVHGLNGHRERTWNAGNGVHWLRDLLPHDLPRARIFCWGYDANTHSGSRVSCQYLYDHARELVSNLCLERQLTETSKRPIIFVAHSLGGIIVKSALIHSDAARKGALEEHRAFKLSTYGIIFMGTPHQGGSGVALGKLMVNIASVFVKADDRLLQHLERDSEWLQQQLGQYGPISGDFVTKFAYETYATPTALGQSMVVVPRASAVVPGASDGEPIAIHADHVNMVRFEAKSDAGYKTVSGHLRVMAMRAGDVIAQRWDTEGRLDAVRSNKVVTSFAVQFSVPEVSHVGRFVGRQEQLEAIHKELQYDGSRKTVVVHGLGGMGKTQLALTYAQRHRDEYSAVFWVNSKSDDTLKQGYAAAADRIFREHPSLVHLEVVAEDSNLDKAADAVKRWLSSAGNDRWLIIFDNYDTPKLPGHDEPGTFDIRPLLPQAHHGAVLITTRSSQLQLGQAVTVSKLQDIEHSLQILSQTSRQEGLNNDPDARRLAEELDGLPLALATAGAYLHQVTTSFADYLRLYKASWLLLQQDTPQLLSYEDRALYSTWNISLEHVRRQSELAAKLLQLWAYFDNQDVWLELLQKGRHRGPEWFQDLTQDQLVFNKAVRVLCDHALVEADAASGKHTKESRGYGMHSCVHAWTMHVVNETWDDDMATLALTCVSFHIPNRRKPEYWVTQQRLLRHVSRWRVFLNTMRIGHEGDKAILDAVRRLGDLSRKQRRLEEAEEMYTWVLKEFEEERDHSWMLETINILGVLYKDQGKLDKAEETFKRALERQEKALGVEHKVTLTTFNNLGHLYLDQDKLNEAEEMLERALEGSKKSLGPSHSVTLRIAVTLGSVYRKQERLYQAEKTYKVALEDLVKSLGDEHLLTLNTINNLGLVYRDQDRLDEAERMFEWALEVKTKAHGPDHKSTLNTVNNLGTLYCSQGRLDKAEQMFERALKGRTKTLGPNHESTLRTANKLSELYTDQGKRYEAEQMLERTLEGATQALGPTHEETLDAANNLNILYAAQGRLDEAEEMSEQVLEGTEAALLPQQSCTPDVATASKDELQAPKPVP